MIEKANPKSTAGGAPSGKTADLEPSWQAILASGRQEGLYQKMAALFARLIEKREPKNRPRGKAGLRAEKGYYRLLYLQGELEKHLADASTPFTWKQMAAILGQLKDLPELREEIEAGIEKAMLEAGAPCD